MDKTIKSALQFLVTKEVEKGSYGFEDKDGDIVSWNDVLNWLEKREVKADADSN